MKRLMVLLLLILMIVALCGCSLFYTAYDSVIPSKLTRGIVEENVYTSAYASLVFTAPEGWIYVTDDDLAKLMDLSVDSFSDAGMEFSEDALKKQTLYDMMCQDGVTGSSVLLLYENLALTGNTSISETDYIKEAIKLLDKAQTVQYEFSEITQEELCGQTYYVMTADMVDYVASQKYYVRKIDKYMLCIIVTVSGGVNGSDVMGCFTEYEAE